MGQSKRRVDRDPPVYRGRLWTSADAARAFRVGVSSVKRWTDEGELESVRTPGGHRRYTAAALHRFASLRGLSTTHLPPASPADSPFAVAPPADVTLLDALIRGDADAVRRLVTPRVDSLPKRAAFLDRVVGDALREIGYRWEGGVLGVDQEHRASHMITEAIDRLRPPISNDGPLAMLACPPGEWHDLPLRLVRLVFEWSGWRTQFLGAGVPWPAAMNAVDRECPAILAYSARNGDPFQRVDFDRIVEHCGDRTKVIVGGEWARGGTGEIGPYLRFRTLRGFERWLRGQRGN